MRGLFPLGASIRRSESSRGRALEGDDRPGGKVKTGRGRSTSPILRSNGTSSTRSPGTTRTERYGGEPRAALGRRRGDVPARRAERAQARQHRPHRCPRSDGHLADQHARRRPGTGARLRAGPVAVRGARPGALRAHRHSLRPALGQVRLHYARHRHRFGARGDAAALPVRRRPACRHDVPRSGVPLLLRHSRRGRVQLLTRHGDVDRHRGAIGWLLAFWHAASMVEGVRNWSEIPNNPTAEQIMAVVLDPRFGGLSGRIQEAVCSPWSLS